MTINKYSWSFVKVDQTKRTKRVHFQPSEMIGWRGIIQIGVQRMLVLWIYRQSSVNTLFKLKVNNLFEC